MMAKIHSSPSRRYVAMCVKTNFEGYYFRSFTLPEHDRDEAKTPFANTTGIASWYFLNRMDFGACIEGVVTEEDFKDVHEHSESIALKDTKSVVPCPDSNIS